MKTTDKLRRLFVDRSGDIIVRAESILLKVRVDYLERRVGLLTRVIGDRDLALEVARREIEALRKGTSLEDAADAQEDLDDAIEIIAALRTLVDFDPDRPDAELVDVVARKVRIAESYRKDLDAARATVATLTAQVHTLARDGVNEVARLILHGEEHETLTQAAHRVMGALSAAVRRCEELEATFRKDHDARARLAGVVGNGAG